MLTRRVLTPLLFCLALALLPALATAAELPLSILGTSTTPIAVGGEKGKDTAEAKFTLLNPGKSAARISIGFQATSSEAVKVVKWAPEEVPAGKAEKITVEFSGLTGLTEAVTGQLVIAGGEAPIAQSVEIDPPAPDNTWPLILIVGSFLAALIFALVVVGYTPNAALRYPAPGPKWSFASWATTLTGVGAVFGTVLGQATFPTFPAHISKAELVNLNILFGIIVVVGPFLSEALRKKEPSAADVKAVRMGTNLTLLISCSFTLWAVLGQLGAFGILGWELLGGGTWAVIGSAAVVFTIAALGVRYFLLTTLEMTRKNWTEEEKKAKQRTSRSKRKPAAKGSQTVIVEAVEPTAAPSWSLL